MDINTHHIEAAAELVPTGDAKIGDAEAGTLLLTLDGYNGPLDDLLTLARSRQVDLAHLSLADLLSQLATALEHAPRTTPLARKADWVVMAAWLVQLRSLLLLPQDNPAQQSAAEEADDLRRRLVALQAAQTLAAWLDRRPQLGRDVFPRGQPEFVGAVVDARHEVDVVEFLWASMALFGDEAPDTTTRFVPPWLDLYSVPEARIRILQRLWANKPGTSLDRLLPDAPAKGTSALRRRSAWATSFVAALELARHGDVVLAQERLFAPITVARPDVAPRRRRGGG
jgi:segregation and condensation protein A